MAAAAPFSAAKATADGTVTSWRVYSASAIQGYSVNVIHEDSGGSWTVTASSQEVTPAGEEVQTFDTDLPILAGEFVELNVPAPGNIGVFSGTSTQGIFSPGLMPGQTRLLGEAQAGGTLGYSAEIEYKNLAPPAVPPPPPAPKCIVPKVIGKKLKAARRIIRKSGCNVGIVTSRHGIKAATGKVVRQSPNRDHVVARHTAVNLKLG